MTTHPRGRLSGLRRYAVPLLVLAAAATTVPLQAVAQEPRPVITQDPDDLPPTPGPGPVRDPQVAAIAQDANQALRYSYAAVAADLGHPYAEGTVEFDLQSGLRTLPADRLEPIVKYAQTLLESDVETRTAQFGRHARLTPDEFRKIGFDGAFSDVRFDSDALKKSLLDRAAALEAAEKAAEQDAQRKAYELHLDFSKLAKLSSLDFRVERVKCVDETNPEWPGDDEIVAGGLRVDHQGTTKKVSQWFVGDGFYDGKAKTYADPGRLFTSFDLAASGPWPRSYLAVVMLAEQDGSGFAAAVQAAWAKVKDKVTQVIAQAVAAVLTPYVGAAIAEALGQLVGWLVGVFVDWLLELFQDDLFEARTAHVELPHRYEFLYNNPAHLGWTNHRLPSTSMWFTGHGGQYKVNVHWQVNS
ncbi:hypothetical protein [Saccharothrix variisporea]|uniref:Uncharacterized protein n=1 Tax=Saccharothrix variisporea TaxID=543527 RepID=A0A495X4X1_9PSEU|nr:hypothetical protein [Saccharothrix variisporea]RKT68977.1 hypothetical protein DFJ66_2170 [Saccharothrix variisporea]